MFQSTFSAFQITFLSFVFIVKLICCPFSFNTIFIDFFTSPSFFYWILVVAVVFSVFLLLFSRNDEMNFRSSTDEVVLKERNSIDETADPRPILKKRSSTDDEHNESVVEKPKPILKTLRR